jgi:sugar phosphate isomerase/epimerase
MCHVKDMLPDGNMTDVGQGTIDFAGIFARADGPKMEHYFVENDDTTTPFESAATSYKALSAILAGLPAR